MGQPIPFPQLPTPAVDRLRGTAANIEARRRRSRAAKRAMLQRKYGDPNPQGYSWVGRPNTNTFD